MSIYGTRLAKGSLHVLTNRGASETFEWTGKSWSTPGTGWGTKPPLMMTLGWQYGAPAQGMSAGTAKTPKAVEGEARQPGPEGMRP